MSEALETLPDDVETLRAMVLAEHARIAALEEATAQAQAATAAIPRLFRRAENALLCLNAARNTQQQDA